VARFLRTIRGGVVAHVPPLALLALLGLAYFLLLGPEDAQVAFTFGIIIATLGKALPVFAIGAAIIGAIWYLLTPRSERSLGRAARWIAAMPWAEIVLLRIPLAFGFTLLLGFLHLSFKVNIAKFEPYAWDHFFAWLDRALFLGHDPWTLSHALMPDLLATMILDMFYMLWFLVMQVSITAVALMPLRSPLRLTFLTAYGLNWVMAGVVLAIAFASGGPVYMEGMAGDTTFRPLTDLLARQSTVEPIMALEAQRLLWEGYVNPEVAPVGISAFPSMHVAIAVTCACLGFAVSRVTGIILTGFAAAIFVGSIHLGWHYAVDGIFAAPMALLFWRLGGFVARRWLAFAGLSEPAAEAAPAPAWEGVPEPVLAAEPAAQEPAGFAKNRFSTSR